MIAVLSVAVLLLSASACGSRRDVQPETTVPETTQETTQTDIEDDFAMPDLNESGSTTAPVIAQTTAPAAPVIQPVTPPEAPPSKQTPASETQTAAAPVSETQTTAAPASETQTSATQPVETTAALTKTSPDLLNNSVLAPINSGNYTMTVTNFTEKNKSSDDKLIQSSRGDDKAYRVTVPSAKLDYRVFSDNGKYYLADGSKYTELTKEQFDSISTAMKNNFVQFNNLQYEGTDEQREGLRNYTREHYTAGDADVTLWFRNKALDHVEIKAGGLQESLPMSVTGSADSSLFSLGESLEQVDYETLKSYADYTNLIFGTPQS